MPRFWMQVITVEAEQFDPHNGKWPMGVKIAPSSISFRGLPAIRTDMTLPVLAGDWIVELPTGERFPIRNTTFRAVAEPDEAASEMAFTRETVEIERPMVRTKPDGRLATICPFCNKLLMSNSIKCEHFRRLRLDDSDAVVELPASTPDELRIFAIFRDTPPELRLGE